VVVLDSGGYGPVTITKSVTLEAPPGVYGGITALSGDGVDVSAGPSDVVVLRNLTITGIGGSLGVSFGSARSVHIEGCTISGWTRGVQVATAGGLHVTDSTISDNTLYGIHAYALTGTAQISIVDSTMEYNLNSAFAVTGNIQIVIADSTVSDNAAGVVGYSSIGPTNLLVERCRVTNNSFEGVAAGSSGTYSATVWVSNCVVTGNLTSGGLDNQGTPSSLLSRQNNTVENNSVNETGVGTFTAKQEDSP
jgi:hypothetical protein